MFCPTLLGNKSDIKIIDCCVWGAINNVEHEAGVICGYILWVCSRVLLRCVLGKMFFRRMMDWLMDEVKAVPLRVEKGDMVKMWGENDVEREKLIFCLILEPL